VARSVTGGGSAAGGGSSRERGEAAVERRKAEGARVEAERQRGDTGPLGRKGKKKMEAFK